MSLQEQTVLITAEQSLQDPNCIFSSVAVERGATGTSRSASAQGRIQAVLCDTFHG